MTGSQAEVKASDQRQAVARGRLQHMQCMAVADARSAYLKEEQTSDVLHPGHCVVLAARLEPEQACKRKRTWPGGMRHLLQLQQAGVKARQLQQP